MPTLIGGGLFLIILAIMQTAVVSRLPLLYGSADLFILFLSAWTLQKNTSKSLEFALFASLLASLVSSLPFYIYFATYFGIVILVSYLKKRIWQTPLLALSFTVILATVFEHGFTMAWMKIVGIPVNIEQALALLSVPAILLNLLVSIPFYALIRDIAGFLYPVEDEL